MGEGGNAKGGLNPRAPRAGALHAGEPHLHVDSPHSGAPLTERFYRAAMGGRFRSWLLSYKESDLWIGVSPESWRQEMEDVARDALRDARSQIEGYAPPQPRVEAAPGDVGGHDLFLRSFSPLPDDPAAPSVVRAMLKAGIAADVGPMAAVAGAIAAHVGRALQAAFVCDEVLVENGGDLWLSFKKLLVIAVFAGTSPLSGRFGVELSPALSPCGLCTSSGTVGPSLSFGYADASVILCRNAALADAWATASCNAVQTADDIDPVLSMLKTKSEILASLIVVGDRMGIQGQFRMRPWAQLRDRARS